MERLLCIVIGYALGCLQTSYIVGKVTRGIDIRDYGSGNSGATNAMRVLGTRVGLACMAGDILKGILALVITSLIYGYDQKNLLLITGVGAVLGHNFPFYMGFKGGKGVAVTIGIMACMDWRCLLIAGIPSLVVLYIGKFMSLASLQFVTIFPLCCIVFYGTAPGGWEVILLSLFYTVMIYWRHSGNIQRLKEGTERRMGSKKERLHVEDENLAEKKAAQKNAAHKKAKK